jgi:hypothetical protein
MGKKNKEDIDINVQVRHETDHSYLIFCEEAPGEEVPAKTWVPKSQCELNDDGTITMPTWLAQERGLI